MRPTRRAGRAAGGGAGLDEYFQDETLRGLIRQALANNHDLRLAVLKVAEARAGYDIQRADQWPTLAGTAQAARGRTPADLSPIGRAVTGNQFSVGLAPAGSWISGAGCATSAMRRWRTTSAPTRPAGPPRWA
jgi:multidrug efflux system outer membrane protein